MLTYREILQAVSDSEADYAWIGLMAAGVYGSTLTSLDFDFFIRPDPAHLDKARAAFRKLGMSELHARVASLEHIIASKLAAGREKDLYTVKRLAEDLGLELKKAPAKYRVRKKRK